MKINKGLLPIKAHYFFFMAAMGPILPQISVYGKEMGISTVVMGTVTGVLPFGFLIAKPLFGIIVDVYRNFRKTIFMALIITMVVAYTLMAFVPVTKWLSRTVIRGQLEDFYLDTCKVIENNAYSSLKCAEFNESTVCQSECFVQPQTFLISKCRKNASEGSNHHQIESYKICLTQNTTSMKYISVEGSCEIHCVDKHGGYLGREKEDHEMYNSFAFWSFLICMAVGTIGFNVVNSITDAICFDVIGEDGDYGKQRVWGTIGFGTTALIGGFIVNRYSGESIYYLPAIVVMLVCIVLDLVCCFKLKLPVIEAPKNIFKDLKELMNDRHVVTFMAYAVLVGILDGFIIYFLFWYVEDLAAQNGTENVKLLEGLIVAAETWGGEIVFFSISGKILERFGHVNCFSVCFVNYALRLGLISAAPNPWWILPVEFLFQGPTYALTYTTVVAYANELAPPGASATMQGIAAGFDDGVGYAIGSILGGLLYSYVGGKNAFQIFCLIGVVCSVSHYVIHKTLIKERDHSIEDLTTNGVVYKSPEKAASAVVINS